MNTNQQGDVKLFQTVDGGNINVEDGVVEMSGGLGTAAYLGLFGGNDDDPGTGDSEFEWWGNIDEEDPDKKYRSQTQYLLKRLATTSGNLRLIEEAAKNDLRFFINSGVADAVEITASIPDLNKISIAGTILKDGEVIGEFEFLENWKAEL